MDDAMSTVEINLDDYLSSEAKAEIAEAEFRQALRDKLRESGGVDRILSNISYYALYDLIDTNVENGGEKLREQIRDRAFKFINKGRNYGIFRPRTHWEGESAATKIVNELIAEKRDLLRARALQLIETMPLSEIRDEIKYVLHEQIDSILKGVEEKR